jgi:hypothetical protein
VEADSRERSASTPVATASPLSSAPATVRRHAGDESASGRRTQVKCLTCGSYFNRTALTRHRKRKHPETPVAALEVDGKVVVRDRLLTQSVPCRTCGQTISAGTPMVTLVYDRDAKRRWSHHVCPAASPNSSAKTHTNNPPQGLDLDLTPNPRPVAGDPPAKSLIVEGEALLTSAEVADLGLTGSRAGTGVLVLEFRGLSQEQVHERERRLLGGSFVRCNWCVDKVVTVLESRLAEHRAVDHAQDLMRWINSGVARDLERVRLAQPRRNALMSGKEP